MPSADPYQLALTLLKEDQGLDGRASCLGHSGGPDQHLALREKIPVYVTYSPFG